MSRERRELVRALAKKNGEEYVLGMHYGRRWAETRSPKGFQSLQRNFDVLALRRIIENRQHPDRAGAIAKALTGCPGFLAMVDDRDDVDYQDPIFLAGFVRGVEEELRNIDSEALAMLQMEQQEELDMKSSFLEQLNKPDRYSVASTLCNTISANRFSAN